MKPQTWESYDFTFKESRIIFLIKQGFTSKEIAKQLNLSEKTIKRHRENIALKAGTRGKEAFRQFVRNFQTFYIE